MKQKAEIEQFLDELRATERYDESESYSFWPVENGLSVTCCTSSARLIAKRFGGAIFGYSCAATDSRIGACSLGHDFAIVGVYLVDYWARFVNECTDRAIFHLRDDAEIIEKLYGDRQSWCSVPL